jgi:hypothetical protein
MKLTAFAFNLFLFASVSLSAQELYEVETENGKAIRYSNITEIGVIGFANIWDILGGTTVNGISINKEHFVGMGLGAGLGRFPHVYSTIYFPLYANYRFYFISNGKSSPHIDLAVGGILSNGNNGFYSSFAIGFRARNFSFSLGMPFIAMSCQVENRIYKTIEHHWDYLYGGTVKIGFTFF